MQHVACSSWPDMARCGACSLLPIVLGRTWQGTVYAVYCLLFLIGHGKVRYMQCIACCSRPDIVWCGARSVFLDPVGHRALHVLCGMPFLIGYGMVQSMHGVLVALGQTRQIAMHAAYCPVALVGMLLL